MTTHVSLNFLKELRKKRKNVRLAKHFIYFCNNFNKLNNTGAQMLDSIYHMELNLLKKHIWREKVKILPSFPQHYYERH